MQVEQLLLAEPENQEYADIFQSLTEVCTDAQQLCDLDSVLCAFSLRISTSLLQVIQLTQDLLREARSQEASTSAGGFQWPSFIEPESRPRNSCARRALQ